MTFWDSYHNLKISLAWWFNEILTHFSKKVLQRWFSKSTISDTSFFNSFMRFEKVKKWESFFVKKSEISETFDKEKSFFFFIKQSEMSERWDSKFTNELESLMFSKNILYRDFFLKNAKNISLVTVSEIEYWAIERFEW